MNKTIIFNICKNETRKRGYRLKWRVAGRDFSRSFKTKAEGQAFERKLQRALEDGKEFSSVNGLPATWEQSARTFVECAIEYTQMKWAGWSPKTRDSFANSIAPVIFELTRQKTKTTVTRADIQRVARAYLVCITETKAPSVQDAKVIEYVKTNSYRLNEIDTSIVTKALTALNLKEVEGTPVASDTFRKRKQTLNAVMDHAFCNHYLNENPVKRVKFSRKVDGVEVDPKGVLSAQACREIQEKLDNYKPKNKNLNGRGKIVSKFVAVIWLAGLRPSEAAGLQKKHLLFEESKSPCIKVEQAAVSLSSNFTDNGKNYVVKELKARGKKVFRKVPILTELATQLKEFTKEMKDDDFIFSLAENRDVPISTDMVHSFFGKVCDSGHTPYDLRHTNASILIYAGLNIIEVANRLGHSITVCSKVYLHLLNETKQIDTSREDEYLNRV